MNRLTRHTQLHDAFNKNALNVLKDEALELEIFTFLQRLSNNDMFEVMSAHSRKIRKIDMKQEIKEIKERYEQLGKYSLTLDNFFKMCIMIQRMNCDLPIILMGESGVGKTALIRFLVEVVYKQTFLCFNVHAGINEERLIKWKEEILSAIKQHNKQEGYKIWVFFDEFNTTDELSYIKEMIIDRKFQGYSFPDNVVFVAACNPYREIKASKHKSAGIKKAMIASNSDNLAFKVKPPPLAMISLMWDYQQLREHVNKLFIT